MNNKLLQNAAWLAVAVGSFAAGKYMVPAGNTASTAVVAPGTQSAGKATEAASQASTAANAKSTTAGSGAEKWINSLLGSAGVISSEKMAEAIGDVIREGDPVKSSLYFAHLLEHLTTENAEAAFKTIREKVGGGFESMRFMPLLGYAWGQKDGKAALAAFDATGGREGGFGKSAVMSGWATNDPDAAIAYLADMKAKRAAAGEGEDQGGGRGGRGGFGGPGGRGEEWGMERGIVTALAKAGADKAMEYIGTVDENRRGDYVQLVAEQKIKDGVESAGTWALSLTDEDQKEEALQAVGRQYVRQDLTAATVWATGISNTPGARDAVGEVADQYSEKDLPAAYTWAQSLQGEGQEEAYGQIFSNWARSDAEGASQELTRLQTGPVKDEAIQEFSRVLAREAPQDAMTWATSISNEEERQEAQIDVAQSWMRRDAEAAKAWISSNLNAEAQQKVTQGQDRGPRGFFGR